jgi:hypothetical protein
MAGARQSCATRSYLSAAAKHGLGFFNALVMPAANQPWIPSAARLHSAKRKHAAHACIVIRNDDEM